VSIQRNKKKIINDPVFGFITIQSELVFDLLEHPWIQRLRRIKQLGLSYLVYPGANHSRFEHTIGAVHLMRQAIASLRLKGHKISDEEAEAVTVAILLHDIGHGPFSHVLENTLVEIGHEKISSILIAELNRQFDNRLELALAIFDNQYHKKFLHQLVSGQLDMDRLDYLARDSFFTGVAEGVVGIERIIKMLEIYNDQLVVEAKGVYSIEKFLIARRLMYWQVYLHKTVLAADSQLINLLRRARELVANGVELFATPTLRLFLENRFAVEDFVLNTKINGAGVLDHFISLDDTDILSSIKAWQNHSDFILSYLAKGLALRRLFTGRINSKPMSNRDIASIQNKVCGQLGIDRKQVGYFFVHKEISNSAYSGLTGNILILDKEDRIKDIRQASDINLSVLTKLVRKFFVSYPKELVFT
jgi:HD superfamily phosphohydrolase